MLIGHLCIYRLGIAAFPLSWNGNNVLWRAIVWFEEPHRTWLGADSRSEKFWLLPTSRMEVKAPTQSSIPRTERANPACANSLDTQLSILNCRLFSYVTILSRQPSIPHGRRNDSLVIFTVEPETPRLKRQGSRNPKPGSKRSWSLVRLGRKLARAPTIGFFISQTAGYLSLHQLSAGRECLLKRQDAAAFAPTLTRFALVAILELHRDPSLAGGASMQPLEAQDNSALQPCVEISALDGPTTFVRPIQSACV